MKVSILEGDGVPSFGIGLPLSSLGSLPHGQAVRGPLRMCFELGWDLAPVSFDDRGVGVAPQLADCAVFVGFAVQDWSSCVTEHQRRRMRGWASSLRCLGRRIGRLIMTIPFPFPLFSFAAQFSLLFSSQSHPLYGLFVIIPQRTRKWIFSNP